MAALSSRAQRRPLRFAAGAFAALAFLALVMSVFLPSSEIEEGEIVLGPARRHNPSPVDAVARLSKGALDAAAGSADDLGFNRDTVLTPSEVELAFVQLVNADRAANGLLWGSSSYSSLMSRRAAMSFDTSSRSYRSSPTGRYPTLWPARTSPDIVGTTPASRPISSGRS